MAMLSGAIGPVPPSPSQLWRRGFDPAGELAARLGEPARIHATATAPPSVLLIDDVLTTGATLTACGQARRPAGAARVVAVTFVRRL
jgi:predicted amidophosphoribosyltransferase